MFLPLVQADGIAEGASVPVLGLSNKAIYRDREVDVNEDRAIPPSTNEQYNNESSFRPLTLTGMLVRSSAVVNVRIWLHTPYRRSGNDLHQCQRLPTPPVLYYLLLFDFMNSQ
jgi:hypothetical protein